MKNDTKYKLKFHKECIVKKEKNFYLKENKR